MPGYKRLVNFILVQPDVVRPVVHNLVTSPTLMEQNAAQVAEMVHVMAHTGRCSQQCLDVDCLPMLAHFYTPVPDLKDLEARDVWGKTSDLPGVDFRPDFQTELLLRLGADYGQECDWPPDPTDDPTAFYTENNSFSFGCAASTHVMLRDLKPRRVVEVGSGMSSRVISQAMVMNQQDIGQAGEYTIVDPYPGEVVIGGLPGLSRVEAQRVELMPVEFFSDLGNGDVLFIDSGHTVRMGGDVNYLFLEVLPRLAPGVVVHVHDIPMPYEYTKTLATNPSFRMFWTESYLLQAFLCFNSQFQVLMAMNYLMFEQAQSFKQAFPLYDPDKHLNLSGSFWIRRKPKPGGQA